MKYILYTIIILLTLSSCKSRADDKSINLPTAEDDILSDTTQNTIPESTIPENEIHFSNETYQFIIKRIDSLEFQYLHDSFYIERSTPIKITSLKTVEKILKDYIRIDSSRVITTDIAEIKDKTGNIISSVEDYKGEFIAYYPMEDILLLNGGHESEMTFNLTTGETTQLIGCPENAIASPNKKYEITGWFGGQECTSYIIRKYINGRFHKIADLVHEDLCYFIEAFWEDDDTFNYSITTPRYQSHAGKLEYYKLSIKEK